MKPFKTLLTSSAVWTSQINKRYNLWRSNPSQFVQDVFSVKPEKWQSTVLQSLVENDSIAIRSGHGVGKTALLSWIIIWWLLTRYPAKIACTAPTGHQLSDVLWGEVAKWHRALPLAIKKMLVVKNDRIEFSCANKSSFAVARTARKEQPEAFQGFHSQHMLFIIDEASGVEDIIFEVGEGAMSTKGAKTLMVGNPTRTNGFFYDAFHKNRSSWKTFKVSCFESAQVDLKFAHKMQEKYGKESPIYQVRVLGEFPKNSQDTLISLEKCEAALKRSNHCNVENTIRPIWGLDVARYGEDRTALAKRAGLRLLEPIQSWQGKDTMEIAGIIKKIYDQTTAFEKPQAICIDVIGIGAGVVDRLLEEGLPVHGINVAQQAIRCERYNRLRDELWFKVKEWIEQNDVYIPFDEQLIAELTTPLYSIVSQGKLKVESKDELKKRGQKSPDLADAFCLTFAVQEEAIEQDIVPKKYQINPNLGRTWLSD